MPGKVKMKIKPGKVHKILNIKLCKKPKCTIGNKNILTKRFIKPYTGITEINRFIISGR